MEAGPLYQASSESDGRGILGNEGVKPKNENQLEEEAIRARFLKEMIRLLPKWLTDIITNSCNYNERRILMINHIAVLVAYFLIFFASPGWTHGGNDHVMGTVTAIDANHLEVKTPEGAVVSVMLTGKTEYFSKNNPPTAKPRVGDRVVADVVKEGKALRAVEIAFTTPDKKARSSR